MSRYQRRNPDFRNTGFRNPVQSPPVVLLNTPTQAGGETLITGTVLSRYGRVAAGSGTAEIARCEMAGFTAAGPVIANCTQIEDLGEGADGRNFRLRFTGTLQLAKGWRLMMPGDWQPMKNANGLFAAGVLSSLGELALNPQGRLLYSPDSGAPPDPPPLPAVINVAVYFATILEVTFDTSGSGDLIATGIWPLLGSSAGLPITMTTVGSSTIQLEYMSSLSSGETMSVAAYSDQLDTVNGWYAPPLYYKLP